MNRHDFRSAYDKIVLPESAKAEMKKKLLELAAGRKAERDTEDGGEFYPAKEYRSEPKKRHTGRNAAIVGSAAAVALTVGAGFWLSRSNITAPDVPAVSTTTEESAEVTDEAFIEDEYYMKRTADGILHFQEFTLAEDAHTQPQGQYHDVYSDNVDDIVYDGAYEFQQRYGHIISDIGYDALYAAELLWSGMVPGSVPNSSDKPLGREVPLEEIYYSDTGMSLIYRSEDGEKQANLSVSTDPEEFIPITIDGKYLVPVGERRSFFSTNRYNIIDPEVFRMAAGSVSADGVEYHSAVYSCKAYDGVTYHLRLDVKNISREDFVECLDAASPFGINQDHRGYYSDGGDINYTETAPDDGGAALPEGCSSATDHGEFYLNQLTYYPGGWNGGFHWNVESSGSLGSTDYSPEDMAEFTGLEVLGKPDIPIEDYSAQISYSAVYDGIYCCEDFPGRGANSEMLPGDDPEQFAQAQEHVDGVYYYDNSAEGTDEAGGADYSSSFYTTDKLDYFKNKTRTGACYTVKYSGGGQSITTTATDDWDLLGEHTMIFGRYPAKDSTAFISGAEGCGKLYAGFGRLEGDRYYAACFKVNGVYVAIETNNLSESDFAAFVAQIYSNGEVEIIPEQEQEYYTKTAALGTLEFQSFIPTTAAHSQPRNAVDGDWEQALSGMPPRYLKSLRESGGVPEYLGVSGLSVTVSFTIDNGAAVILTNSAGTRLVNFSISRSRNDFVPLLLSDGSYLTPEEGRKSSFALSWLDFINPECFTMAVGEYVDGGGDTYYVAEYDYVLAGIGYDEDAVYHCRIDAVGITREEFLDCIDDASQTYLTYDHKGWYNTEGGEVDLHDARLPQTGGTLPEPVTKDTEYGTLTFNPMTAYCGHIPAANWNIMGSSDDTDIPEELRYTVSDAVEYGRMEVLNGMSAQSIFGVPGSTRVDYSAWYKGITNEYSMDGRFGANLEMAENDDPEQFAEAMKYVVKSEMTVTEDGSTRVETYGSHYRTDKLDYFDRYIRKDACYEVTFSTEDGSYAHIGVFSDWALFDEMDLVFARYPGAESSDFKQGADNFGRLYVGRGYDASGRLHYVAGWALSGFGSLDQYAATRYAVLDMCGADEDTFARTLALLYSNGDM